MALYDAVCSSRVQMSARTAERAVNQEKIETSRLRDK